MHVGYLGPPGTFSEEALRAGAPDDATGVPFATIHEVAAAVARGDVHRGLVPIENSLEGAVNATLDALTAPDSRLAIVGESVLEVSQCLIARAGVAIGSIEVVISHPQPLGQCARFIRDELPGARVEVAASTADAALRVAASAAPWAAIGPRRAAEIAGCEVLRAGIEDDEGNATRFVWLAAADDAAAVPAEGRGPYKTSIMFAGDGDESPGWLVRCLTELSSRAVNLTKIESRPQRGRLGHYLFLADLDGRLADARVAEAVEGLRVHCPVLRVLGSYPAALRR